MKKITLLSIFVVATTIVSAQNMITNGNFDDNSGWTITNHYEVENTLGLVTFSNGVVTFDETVSGDWKHIGIYTSVVLEPGIYQFDMEMTYTDINDVWGEVFIGSAEPLQNEDYGGDLQIIKAYNAWDCPDIKTYDGLATASGCDENDNPGEFEITTAGTYYLLFRTGGSTYGTTGIVLDNLSLTNTPLSNQDFEISDLKVYPNPTNDVWNFTTTQYTINAIDVFDMFGKKVISLAPNNLSAEVDASKLTAGIYFTKITTDSGIISQKLIKQ